MDWHWVRLSRVRLAACYAQAVQVAEPVIRRLSDAPAFHRLVEEDGRRELGATERRTCQLVICAVAGLSGFQWQTFVPSLALLMTGGLGLPIDAVGWSACSRDDRIAIRNTHLAHSVLGHPRSV